MEDMSPRGGARPRAGRKREFDGFYQLKYKTEDRRRWQDAANRSHRGILSNWIRDILNQAAR